MLKHLGVQLMVELYGCDESILDDKTLIGDTMVVAAKKANATVVQQFFHQFSPYGVSGTVVIAESHINIHTWPEFSYAAVDIFTCGPTLDADAAITFLSDTLGAERMEVKKYLRGNKEEIERLK